MLVDTSVLMMSAEVGRDIISLVEDKVGERVEPLVVGGVLRELGLRGSRGGRAGAAARVARKIAEGMGVVGGVAEGGVDEELLEKSRETGLPVLTADKELLSRLRRNGCKAIYVTRSLEVKLFV